MLKILENRDSKHGLLKILDCPATRTCISPFNIIIAWGGCKISCSICEKPIRKIHSKLTLSTRSPLKQVRSPSGAPPEPLEIQGGAPQVPFCFRLESAATHEGILCGKLPPCYVVAINYQPTGQSSGYSIATRQACIFLTPGALLAPAGRSLESGRSGRSVGRLVGRSVGWSFA